MGTRYLNEFRFQWGGQKQFQGPHGAPRWTDYQSFGPERFRYLQQQFDFPSFDYEPDNVYFVHHSPVKPEFRNDFSIATSNHNIKLGGAYQNLTLKEDAQGNSIGSWQFSSDQPFDHENPAILGEPARCGPVHRSVPAARACTSRTTTTRPTCRTTGASCPMSRSISACATRSKRKSGPRTGTTTPTTRGRCPLWTSPRAAIATTGRRGWAWPGTCVTTGRPSCGSLQDGSTT